MKFQYDINQISSKCQVSKQSLYSLIKKHQEFINENSTRIQRKVYYNQAVMDFFIDYYQPKEPVEEGKKLTVAEIIFSNKPETPENPSLEGSIEEKTNEIQSTALQAEIDALQAEIDALKKELASKEEERKELLHQNGALILTLQQEKQEKQIFLPAPKKSFSVRLKTFLKSRSHHE